MMTVAISYWQGRISPVFDVSATVLIITISGGKEQSREDVTFGGEGIQARVARLVETGAGVLICGGVSWPLEVAIAAAGIEVISQTCGEVEEVVAAYIGGYLARADFRITGCSRREH